MWEEEIEIFQKIIWQKWPYGIIMACFSVQGLFEPIKTKNNNNNKHNEKQGKNASGRCLYCKIAFMNKYIDQIKFLGDSLW